MMVRTVFERAMRPHERWVKRYRNRANNSFLRPEQCQEHGDPRYVEHI